jgi:flavin-dependent dehydrogenase
MAREIRIVGGGLAGLSLGVALQSRGVPVELWEAGALPRHRVCGEFISGVRPATLAFLGIADLLTDAHRHETVAWYRGDGRRCYRARLPRPALGISRHVLDERIARRLEDLGGRVRREERWRGPLDDPGCVLGSGRQAERGSPWIGLKVHAKAPRDYRGSDLSLFLGERGYLGMSAVEDGWWNACGLFRKRPGVRGSKDELLGRYAEAAGITALAGERFPGVRAGSGVGVAALSFALPERSRDGLLRLGDAWGLIPPFTGNGMSIAFESAESAVSPLLGWAAGGVPWEEVLESVEQAHQRRFRRRFQVARVLHGWLLGPGRQRLLLAGARTGLLPFRTLFAWTHG